MKLRAVSAFVLLPVLLLTWLPAGRLVYAQRAGGQEGGQQAVLSLPSPPAKAQEAISLPEYQAKLKSLEELVEACQQAMSPATCQSDQVGSDLTLALPSGGRAVRFGWLRSLLDQAAHPNVSPDKEASQTDLSSNSASAKAAPPPQIKPLPQPKPLPQRAPRERNSPGPSPEDVIGIAGTPNIFKQLESARRRLVQDQNWAADAASMGKPKASRPADEHAALTAILAAKEYHAATAGKTIKDRILEKIANWLDITIGELIKAGSKSKWIGVTAEIGFLAVLCVGLVWLLIHLERQGRMAIESRIRPDASTGAASARDWRLWAEDAHQAAAQGAWREAIHFLYWSSISRLESSGVWSADRARTPREYLAALSTSHSRRPELSALTRSLERTWYAGSKAGENDFRQAEKLAASLAGNPGVNSGPDSGTSAER